MLRECLATLLVLKQDALGFLADQPGNSQGNPTARPRRAREEASKKK